MRFKTTRPRLWHRHGTRVWNGKRASGRTRQLIIHPKRPSPPRARPCQTTLFHRREWLFLIPQAHFLFAVSSRRTNHHSAGCGACMAALTASAFSTRLAFVQTGSRKNKLKSAKRVFSHHPSIAKGCCENALLSILCSLRSVACLSSVCR